MTRSEIMSLWANGTLSAKARVVKLGSRWFVKNAERPDELCHGPVFKTRMAAEKWAEVNMKAVLERLKEQESNPC